MNKQVNSSISIWRSTYFYGYVLTILAVVTLFSFPQSGANLSDGIGSPAFAFEIFETEQDLVRIFGEVGDKNRAERINQMRRGLYWDYPFLLVYGMFIWCFFTACKISTESGVWLVFGIIGIISALSDAIENVFLLSALDQFSMGSGAEDGYNILLLHFFVWTKFFGLFISGLAACMYIFKHGEGKWKVLTICSAFMLISVLLAFIEADEYGKFTLFGIGAIWIVQCLYAIFNTNIRSR